MSTTSAKITGRLTHCDTGWCPERPSNSWGPRRVTSFTGKMSANATRTARVAGARRNRFSDERARRNPTPIPKKLAKSTKFGMFARWTLSAAVQRISASSRKSVSMLSVTRRHGLSSNVKLGGHAADRRRGSPLLTVEVVVVAISGCGGRTMWSGFPASSSNTIQEQIVDYGSCSGCRMTTVPLTALGDHPCPTGEHPRIRREASGR